MKARGEFYFKGIEKKEAGEFTNVKGELVKYGTRTILKVDELVDGSVNERKLRIDTNNTFLIDKLKKLKLYEIITLECDVVLYQNSAKVVPIGIIDSNNK